MYQEHLQTAALYQAHLHTAALYQALCTHVSLHTAPNHQAVSVVQHCKQNACRLTDTSSNTILYCTVLQSIVQYSITMTSTVLTYLYTLLYS